MFAGPGRKALNQARSRVQVSVELCPNIFVPPSVGYCKMAWVDCVVSGVATFEDNPYGTPAGDFREVEKHDALERRLGPGVMEEGPE